MAVNFALVDAFDIDPNEDPMDRTWAGWDRTATDQELWEVNRGRWRIDERALARERFATISYRGVIQLAAELSGYELVSAHPKPGMKKALLGEVLVAGDPVRDALVGRTTRRQRNPVGYLDTSVVDAMSPAQRAQVDLTPTTRGFLATNNPDRWAWDDDDYHVAMADTAAGKIVRGQWATGSRKKGIEPGDRVFLLRQGRAGRGLVGSGAFTSRVFPDLHWDDTSSQDANYALIDWDTLIHPDDALPTELLITELPDQHWEPQAGGTLIRPEILDDLERMWADHIGRPVPRRTAPRQKWQLDPERRKKVEDAAQQRLMEQYRALGWAVKDTRHGNPYDAVAVKGSQVLYLEAKGTETAGRAVIVTRGEVEHANAHPGQCVIGILSDIEFTSDGEVAAGSGVFRIFDWQPRTSDLSVRQYDYTPPENTLNGR
jgi:hypothetical protein